MSLPERVHATVQRCATDAEGFVYVASLEEMPGIQCSATGQADALQELRRVVDSIQERTGGVPVEIVDPPFIGFRWVQYGTAGDPVHEFGRNFDPVPAPDVSAAQEEMAL